MVFFLNPFFVMAKYPMPLNLGVDEMSSGGADGFKRENRGLGEIIHPLVHIRLQGHP
jgi:hypothetical protein